MCECITIAGRSNAFISLFNRHQSHQVLILHIHTFSASWLVWYPIYACDTLQSDRIHRKFLKFLSFRQHGAYPKQGISQNQLLERFDMNETRRNALCERTFTKILNNKIDCSFVCGELPFMCHVSSPG